MDIEVNVVDMLDGMTRRELTDVVLVLLGRLEFRTGDTAATILRDAQVRLIRWGVAA